MRILGVFVFVALTLLSPVFAKPQHGNQLKNEDALDLIDRFLARLDELESESEGTLLHDKDAGRAVQQHPAASSANAPDSIKESTFDAGNREGEITRSESSKHSGSDFEDRKSALLEELSLLALERHADLVGVEFDPHYPGDGRQVESQKTDAQDLIDGFLARLDELESESEGTPLHDKDAGRAVQQHAAASSANAPESIKESTFDAGNREGEITRSESSKHSGSAFEDRKSALLEKLGVLASERHADLVGVEFDPHYPGDDRQVESQKTEKLSLRTLEGHSGLVEEEFEPHYPGGGHLVESQKTASCGDTLSVSYGTITSPNYPYEYPNNLNCEYRIMAQTGQVIQFVFTSLAVEPGLVGCPYDSVRLYDGVGTNAPLLASICGASTLPSPFLTTGNTAKLVFKTDGSVVYSGFSVDYQALGQAFTTPSYGGPGQPTPSLSSSCGGDFSQSAGTIRSPNYQSNYDNQLSCVWNIRVTYGKMVQFNVADFSLEPHITCNNDYLEIRDGSRILGKYCGDINMRIPSSSGNDVTLILKTNGATTGRGFCINYRTVDAPSSSAAATCGLVSGAYSRRAGNKIINGLNSQADALPWQVQLQKYGSLWCGGIVIHASWILTAAHCITRNSGAGDYRIIAGTIYKNPETSTSQIRSIQQIISHALFNDDSYRNDIALLKLSSPLSLNTAVKSICIPSTDVAAGSSCTVSGWGNTNTGYYPSYPTTLKRADLYIESPDLCSRVYGQMYNFDSRIQMCAYRADTDSCQGDSGGPFARLDGGRYFLDGIVSYGRGCAQPYIPGVYTRVSAYASWISQNTGGAVSPFNG